MSSNKLKADLQKKLDRQTAALEATRQQLDWVEQLERSSSNKAPTK